MSNLPKIIKLTGALIFLVAFASLLRPSLVSAQCAPGYYCLGTTVYDWPNGCDTYCNQIYQKINISCDMDTCSRAVWSRYCSPSSCTSYMVQKIVNCCALIAPTPPPSPPPPGPTPTPGPTPPPPLTGDARPRYQPDQIYPFPCNKVAPSESYWDDFEFHSLRPYQKSPCNEEAEDLAMFCGNNFTLTDTVKIIKTFYPPTYTSVSYSFEGNRIDPDPPVDVFGSRACRQCVDGICVQQPPPCIPDPEINCQSNDDCNGDCIDNGDGTETCTFTIDRSRQIAIDLEGAYLPIMGYTEPSVGAEDLDIPKVINNYYGGPETLDDAAKVNEYVSWYLNGVIGRSEYPPPDTDTEEGREKMIDYSGPLKKLLSWASQAKIRIDEVNDAYLSRREDAGIRHNQIVGCTNAAGQRTPCPTPRPLVDERRMAGMRGRLPPLPQDYSDVDDFIDAYHTWVATALTDLFSYVPFSSTEDRIGLVEISTYSIHPAIGHNVKIISAALTGQEPAELFFAHMQEGSELSRLLQQTFAPHNGPIDEPAMDAVVSAAPFCDLRAIRSNPGDNLFAGTISADLNYTASVECEFHIKTCYGEGGKCYSTPSCNAIGGTLIDNVAGCNTAAGELCCSATNACEAAGGRCYSAPSCFSIGSSLVNGGAGCNASAGEICCRDICKAAGGMCFNTSSCSRIGSVPVNGGNGCNAIKGELCCSMPIVREECSVDFFVTFSTITETPLAQEVWARLVAGPAGVFRRIFPKIEEEEGQPIQRLWDIPAATSVKFESSAGVVLAGNPTTRRPGDEAELYFPHIGGIHEYFLKCIQKTLRPQGFGEGCVSGPEPLAGIAGPTPGVCGVIPAPPHEGPTPVGGGSCQPAVAGWCSVATLRPYFGTNTREASIICNMESGGWTNAFNDGCLCGRSLDYSVGLFQINLLAHCSGAFNYGWGPPPWCKVVDQSRVDSCSNRFFDPIQNIRYAVQLSNGGTNWSPWAAAAVCGL